MVETSVALQLPKRKWTEIISILSQNRPTVGTLGALTRFYFQPMPDTPAEGRFWYAELVYIDYFGNQGSPAAFRDSVGVAIGYSTISKDGSIKRVSFGFERIRQNPGQNDSDSHYSGPVIRVSFLWK